MVRIDAIFLLNDAKKTLRPASSFDKAQNRRKSISAGSTQKSSTVKKSDVEEEILETENKEDKTKEQPTKSLKRMSELLQPHEMQMLLCKTHLHLQKRKITHIDDMRACKNVRILFLQENNLKRIGHLRHLHYLQELYLNDNQIIRIEGLSHMQYLKKLLLPRNRIGVIEGLPPNLEELEVGGQLLPPGHAMLLDPHAFQRVQESMKFLDVCENRLTEIGVIGLLHNLQVLRASYNDIQSLDHVCNVVRRLRSLVQLDFRGNPVTTLRKYRPEITRNSQDTLEFLDEKKVLRESRAFLTGMENRKNRPTKVKIVKPEKMFLSDNFLFDVREGYGRDFPTTEENANVSKYVLGTLLNNEFQVLLDNAKECTKVPLEIEEKEAFHNDQEEERGCVAGGHLCSRKEPLLPRVIPKPFLRHKNRN